MKSYKNIVNRHIFLKKKHFFLTLLGIIMSVALLTAMMTLMYSLVENLRLNDIKNNGSFHLTISGISPEDALLIARKAEIESSGIVYDTNTVSMGKYTDEVSAYYGLTHKILKVSLCDKGALSILPLQLEEGNYPENSEEIIVDRWFIRNYDDTVGIGSKVTLQQVTPDDSGYTESGMLEYTITGIIFSNDNITTDAVGRAATLYDPSSNKDSDATVYVRITKSSSIAKFKETISDITKQSIIENNNSLIGLEGRDGDMGVMGPIFSIGLFLAAIIMVATIAVIYNSFNISVLEKTSLYGLLRTSGATPRQIRKLVYREASFYAAIGIPLGTLIGLGVTYILLEFVGFEPFNLTGSGISTFISPWFVLMGILIGILTVYLSAYIPALRAGRISPVEAISGKKNVVLSKSSKINRRTVLGRLLGLPGTMAAKNLVRNKKRFRVTLFSIIISSILFIVFNSLAVLSIDNSPYVSVGFDYIISNGSTEYVFSKDDIIHFAGIPGIENVYASAESEYLTSLNAEYLFYPDETNPENPLLIVNDKTLDMLSSNAIIPTIYIDAADDSDLDYINDELTKISHLRPWYHITDITEWERQNRKLTVQLLIFFYGFLTVIIMIGSLNIINTINTSLIQRRREFAILGSVGMTGKQLSGMVVIETLVQGLKAGFIGSAAGIALVFALHQLFGQIQALVPEEFSVPWGILGITMVSAVVISLLSCIAPMKKLRNQDIIATIRSLE